MGYSSGYGKEMGEGFMRNSFYIGLIFLLLGSIVLMIKFNFDVSDLRNEIYYDNIVRDKKIEELEKEIRILKTDVDVIQYGFESE